MPITPPTLEDVLKELDKVITKAQVTDVENGTQYDAGYLTALQDVEKYVKGQDDAIQRRK